MRAKILGLVAGTVLAGGCGVGPHYSLNVSRRVAPYYARFEAAAVQHGAPAGLTRGIGARFVPKLPGRQVGVCVRHPTRGREIKFSAEAWLAADDAEREQVVFHELGHCALGRGHEPVGHGSLMEPALRYGAAEWLAVREWALRELFSTGRGVTRVVD